MGVVTNAKEDLNDMAMPCITITTVTNGEYMKATNLSLKLSSWAPFDMTGSKQGKDNSFGKLGIEISSYSNVEDSGIQSISQLVKAVKNVKGKMALSRKTASTRKAGSGPKRSRISSQERENIQGQGRELVKFTIAHMSKEGATNPQLYPSTGSIDHITMLEQKEYQTKEQGKKQKGKQRMKVS